MTSLIVRRLAELLTHPEPEVSIQGAELLRCVTPAEAAASLRHASRTRYGGLHGLSLNGVILRGQDLRGLRLQNNTLEGTDLRGANLSGASLASLWLKETRLDGADLRGVRYRDCRHGDLRTAKIDGMHLLGSLDRTRWGARTPLFLPSERCLTCGAQQGSTPYPGAWGRQRGQSQPEPCWDPETGDRLHQRHHGRWRRHSLYRTKDRRRVVCRVCKASWSGPPHGSTSCWCPGIPLFRGWDAVPATLTTKTQAMKKHGIPRTVLDALPAIPAAWIDTRGGYRNKLWRLEDLRTAAGIRATQLPEFVPAQQTTPPPPAPPANQLTLF